MNFIGGKVIKENVVGEGNIRRVDVVIGSDITLWLNLGLKGGTVNQLDLIQNKVFVSTDHPEFGAEFQKKYNGRSLRLFIRDTAESGIDFQEVAVKGWHNNFYGLEIDLV